MGYIKKLKNNELVGGTDKHTIYPVTSTKAVFEEVTNGNESSFKSQKTINKEQQDELDAHNGRVTYLEDHAVKSVTINGGTKTYTVDDAGNVNLDVYTTESAEGQATLAEEVGDIRSIVGTKDSPASDTLVNRVGELETLVGGSGQGSVNTRIANAKAEILGDAAEDYNTLGKVEDKIQEEVARATAEETELSIYVHAIEGGNIRVKSSTPTNPDTGAPANTVYRVAGTTTYSDYMWNGTTMVKMAEYNVDTLESQFGYYKWETASNTISITTSNQVAGSPIGSYVLTSGGSFKIKMTNKATGACTLNMNGTGVKTLLYNGDPVASNNTWENDEVISVYYDGTSYQASNSQGGSNRKIDAYLLGDLRTLALGQNYDLGESLRTEDKQFLRMTKAVDTMNTTDTVAVGDLKVYSVGSAGTYKALKAVNAYNGTDTEGLYAIGRPSIVTITVDSSSLSIEEDTDVEVTIGEVTQTITVPAAASETKNADIAALIAAAFTSVPGWTLTDNEDGTLTLRCNTGGANTITVSSNVGETGLSITSSAVNGAATLSKCVEGTWTAVTLADYAADSINPGETADGEMWQKLTLEELISYSAIQDTLMSKFISDELHKSILGLYVKANTSTPVNNPLNLEVGKTYRIVIKLSAVATGSGKGFWLRQTYNQSNPNKQIANINVGEDTVDFEYTPPENSNYQYISAWTSSGAFTYSVYIYEKKQVNKVPKIYDDLGYNDNGSISQRALTEILNKGIFETLIETNIDTSILTKTSGSLGSGKMWIFNNSCNHVVIPCTEGDEFDLKTTGSDNFWGWLRDYNVPKSGDSILYTSGEDRHWYPSTKPTVAPAGAKYLCLVTRNGDGNSSTWTGTAKIKAPLYDILNNTVSKEEFEASLDAEIAQFKSEFSNDVNKYIFTPSSYIPITESHEVYGSTHCYQGCALYGNYLVSISNSSITQLCIYNLETKTVIASSIALPTFQNTRFHGNTLSFSNTKYDTNDEFPLLYCCTGSTITTSSSEGQVYVVRIVNNESVYSTELIQTITLDFGIVNGWNEFVVDAENNRAWITGSGKRFYICVALPSIGEDVTINNDTPLIDSFDIKHARTGVSTSSSGQDKFFYKGRIYSANGVPGYTGQGVDALYISVDNTLTHCREAVAPLKNYGITQEPEACFIWRNELYVVMKLGTIHKLIQN